MNHSFKPMLKKVYYKNLLTCLIIILLALIGLTILALVQVDQVLMGLIFVIAGIIITISILGALISYHSSKYTRYLVYDDRLERKTNFLSYNKTTIPVENVTNISYIRNIISDRLFGTGTLEIYTSGSSSVDMRMENVENVEKKYIEISKLLGLTDSSSYSQSGEKVTTQSESFLFRVKPFRKAITVGLVLTALIGIPFFIFALIFTIPPIYMLLSDPLGGVIAVFIPFIVLILIALGLYTLYAYLTLKRFDRMYYDFYTDKLEYYDGFMTLRKASIPFERITNVSSNKNLIDRILGVTTIEIETAGSGGADIVIKNVKEGKVIVEKLKEELRKNGRN